MSTQILLEDHQWLWLALGAAACIACGVLFRIGVPNLRGNERRRSKMVRLGKSPVFRSIKHRTVEDSKEKPCVEVGATLLEQLRREDWHIRTSDALEGLNFSSISKPHLVRMAGELWFVLRKNIISLETACERYETRKNVFYMLKQILLIHANSVEALNKFGKVVLNLDLQTMQVISAAAQGYPHCMCFLADHGTCVEIVAALAVGFPSWQRVCGRLRDELKKSRPHWESSHFELLDELARTIENFDEIAIKAISEALALQDTSRRRIESSTKVLEESEKLFWEHIVATGSGDDNRIWPTLGMTDSNLELLLPTQREMVCLDEVDNILLGEPQAGGGMDLLTSEVVFPQRLEMKESQSHPVSRRETANFRYRADDSLVDLRMNAGLRRDSVGDVGTRSRGKLQIGRPRSNTVPVVPNFNRFENMSKEEQEKERSEMNCLIKTLAGKLNKMQDKVDEKSCSSSDKSASPAESLLDVETVPVEDNKEQLEIIAITRKITQLTSEEKESKNKAKTLSGLEISHASLFDLDPKNRLLPNM